MSVGTCKAIEIEQVQRSIEVCIAVAGADDISYRPGILLMMIAIIARVCARAVNIQSAPGAAKKAD
jgi:hypothetical protein